MNMFDSYKMMQHIRPLLYTIHPTEKHRDHSAHTGAKSNWDNLAEFLVGTGGLNLGKRLRNPAGRYTAQHFITGRQGSKLTRIPISLFLCPKLTLITRVRLARQEISRIPFFLLATACLLEEIC